MDPRLDVTITNLSDFLPELLTIKGRMMSLVDHYPFLPMFDIEQAPLTVWQAGRQLGKTRSAAANFILRAALEPGHETLVVLPLQDQSDRLSTVIFRPMTTGSPVAAVLAPDGEVGSVRIHQYANGSTTYFSYASDDAERIRSYSARCLYIDEGQDIDTSFVPIMVACLDGQDDPGIVVSGSSKTKDTFLYNTYQQSSQGVWCVKCGACGFVNRCCLEPDGHLIAMIDTRPRDDISEARPGTVCKQCRTPVNPRFGRWDYRYPERHRDVAGYHVPQIIMPGHFARPEKWRKLVSKMNGGLGFTIGRFYNEVLGEPYDAAYKMITLDDLKAAGRGVGPNNEANAVTVCHRYQCVILGVDWGGGGEDGVSRTKVAAVGFRHDGRLEVFFGAQFPPGADPVSEAEEVVRLANVLSAVGIAHDFNGAGTVAESVMTHRGIAINRIIPIVYASRPGMRMLSVTPAVGHRVRSFYQADKGRSIQFLCAAIKAGHVRFFDYDYVDPHRTGLLHDFLSIVSFTIDTPTGSVFRIRKQSESMSDDFAHATNFACMGLWEMHRSWPNLAVAGSVSPPIV